MKSNFRPWLWLPPKMAHDFAPYGLKFWSLFSKKAQFSSKLTVSWKGYQFKHPLGIAGGVDKQGKQVLAWQKLGAAFVEVGTITPEPQTPNPGTIILRESSSESLWNCMGFPNDGSQKVKKRLLKIQKKIHIPIFLNIGKNRNTPNEAAHEDYLKGLESFKDITSIFVLNISSPNTKNLRELLEFENLKKFLSPLQEYKDKHKLQFLLKLSPDMALNSLDSLVIAAEDLGVDGWVLTNTTSTRPGGAHSFPKDRGGVSGQSLKPLSVKFLKEFHQVCLKYPKKDRLVISAGGVAELSDWKERAASGAHLAQVYSALIFKGPSFFKKFY